MTHKTHAASETARPAENRVAVDSRAAQAAARVAARYASAPSYSEMLAEEARAALRAAEAATRAAQKAHAAAQSVLDGLEAAASAESGWNQQAGPEYDPERQSADLSQVQQDSAGPTLVEENLPNADRREPEQAATPAKPAPSRKKSRRNRAAALAIRAEDQDEEALPTLTIVSADDALINEVAQPIYANLIRFPREVVATRKVRPRRIEGPLATAAPTEQLSIFEVDPGTISTQPASPAAEEPAPAWMRPDWSSIELEEQSRQELPEEPAPQTSLPTAVQLAPLSRRLLAFIVDASLIVAAFLGAAALVVSYGKAVPGPRALEFGTAVALLMIGAAYLSLFFTLANATPGMKYAGIDLTTFDGQSPSRAQRLRRLRTMLLSVSPLGLGLIWALFDDAHLTWHDRLSKTYLRRY